MRLTILALVLGLAGCGPPLGTNDVELDYTASTPPSVRAVHARLRAARLEAEVRGVGRDGLAIVIDAEYADYAEHLLAWPGGLTVYRLDTHAPVLELRGARLRVDGKRVVVAIDDPEAAARIAREPPGERVGLMFASVTYWKGSLRDCLATYEDDATPAIVVPRGDDLAAYKHARNTALLFASPTLPALTRTSRLPLPVDWPLAIGCVVLPLVVGIGWIFFIRRLDRARPEPWWLVLATFALGGAGALLAALVERVLSQATPYLDHRTMALDLSASALPISLLVCTVVVGFVEEGAKLLAAWSLAMHRREFDEPVDGIVFAAVAAIGFATVENVVYFTHYRFGDGLTAVRSLECVSGHLMYAAIWGYALGQRLVRKTRVLPYFVAAALLHAAWDTAITFLIPHALIVLTFIATTAFVVVLRKALRWGAIDPALPTPPGVTRASFAVGRLGAFILAVIAAYAFGYLLEELGYSAEHDGYRVNLALLGWSALYGSLFVIAAWGVAAMMPLDVVVDDTGVTFGGALRRWAQVRGVTRVDAWAVAIQAEHGDLRFGPGRRATIDRLEAALRAHLSASDPVVVTDPVATSKNSSEPAGIGVGTVTSSSKSPSAES